MRIDVALPQNLEYTNFTQTNKNSKSYQKWAKCLVLSGGDSGAMCLLV